MSLRHLRVPLVLALVVATLLAQAGTSLALFTESKASSANTFTAGTWAFYLHNNPTPPTGNTTAQVNLVMNATVPTATTLYQYATNCAARAGRRITRAAPNPNQATVCNYENWRTPALATAMTLSGTVTMDVWATTDAANANRTGVLVAYLRDYNPTGGTYVEIGNATNTYVYPVGRTTFYERAIAVAVTGTYTVAAGHQLEIKLEASNAGQNAMLVAYDTTAYKSYLRIC
ncbi:MAG: SipW-dependent-type signal peptide-containing protein [Candidatus Limnocylindrales bacterium]|jgi:predicted ribosomally synthesized peptide with SipW-like signal peptide